MNTYNVIIHESFFEDLEIIFNFCMTSYGLNYASKTLKKILETTYSLSALPNSNPIYSINNNTILRKKVVNKRYVIIFRVIYNFVYVYTIFDGRKNENPTNLFKSN